MYPCGFLTSSLCACLWETLPGILWESPRCAKTNQRLVTKTCLKLDIVYGKTSAPHILPKHIMDILVLMEVAYQMAKFGDNYKLKEYMNLIAGHSLNTMLARLALKVELHSNATKFIFEHNTIGVVRPNIQR